MIRLGGSNNQNEQHPSPWTEPDRRGCLRTSPEVDSMIGDDDLEVKYSISSLNIQPFAKSIARVCS